MSSSSFPTYHEIPTILRERTFVKDRRIAEGLAHPDDFRSVNLTGAFLVSAAEEADILVLRRGQGGMYGPVGSEDEQAMFESVKARLLREVAERAGRGVMVKEVSLPSLSAQAEMMGRRLISRFDLCYQEPGVSGGVPLPAVKVKTEPVVAGDGIRLVRPCLLSPSSHPDVSY